MMATHHLMASSWAARVCAASERHEHSLAFVQGACTCMHLTSCSATTRALDRCCNARAGGRLRGQGNPARSEGICAVCARVGEAAALQAHGMGVRCRRLLGLEAVGLPCRDIPLRLRTLASWLDPMVCPNHLACGQADSLRVDSDLFRREIPDYCCRYCARLPHRVGAGVASQRPCVHVLHNFSVPANVGFPLYCVKYAI